MRLWLVIILFSRYLRHVTLLPPKVMRHDASTTAFHAYFRAFERDFADIPQYWLHIGSLADYLCLPRPSHIRLQPPPGIGAAHLLGTPLPSLSHFSEFLIIIICFQFSVMLFTAFQQPFKIFITTLIDLLLSAATMQTCTIILSFC